MKFGIIFFISVGLIFHLNAQNINLGGEKWDIYKGEIQLKGSLYDALGKRYWNYLNSKLPKEILKKYISSLRLFTDGRMGELAGMSPVNILNTQWEIDIDTLDFNFNNKEKLYIKDYTHTIIHEFGHLLTLNPEQVEVTEDVFEDDMKGYLTSEGYTKTNSYLNKFVDRFWRGKLLRRWDKIDKIKSENRKVNLLYKLYLKNENQFLTAYSAESPEEDIAESWTFFVLYDKPKLNTIKHQKILFFYQFPELIEQREKIRNKLEKKSVD